MPDEPLILREGDALHLDFIDGVVSVIDLEEANRLMRERSEIYGTHPTAAQDESHA